MKITKSSEIQKLLLKEIAPSHGLGHVQAFLIVLNYVQQMLKRELP